MSRNKSFMYSVAFLSLSIPVQGRFVYGLTLILELILLELIGTLVDSLVKKLKFEVIRTYFVMMILISTTILFRQILVITYSEIALALGLVFYFPTVSTYLFDSVFFDSELKLGSKLKENLLRTLKFSFVLILFYLFRDILGFGTFTFFGNEHRIYEKIILNPDKIGIFMFFASIPGSLILVGVLIYLLIFFKNKILSYGAIAEKQNSQNPVNNESSKEEKK